MVDVPVSIAQSSELIADEATESGTNETVANRRFQCATDVQVNVICECVQ